ncbi:hypothetical protein [Amycolatopsis sp.]|uniref:hypothetical protein n=1 Tax=Amycolatopsis sp. TaxID=37632 RepID=UPI002E0CDC0D|nr:hypothetical protein [Amycolatopsis sp.]
MTAKNKIVYGAVVLALVVTGAAVTTAAVVGKSDRDTAAPATDTPMIGDATQTGPGTTPCAAGQLRMDVAEARSPNDTGRMFQIDFAAHPAVSCTLSGSLGDIRFLDAEGQTVALAVGASAGAAEELQDVTVAGDRTAVVYIVTPKASGEPNSVTSIGFSLPASRERVKLAWPSPVDGPVNVTPIMAPVG